MSQYLATPTQPALLGSTLCCLMESPHHGPLPVLPLPTEEQPVSCRHLTELRNLTKGACYLEQVEVSYCSGHCPSSTTVLPEVSMGRGACRFRGGSSISRPPGPAAVSLAPRQSPGDTSNRVILQAYS